MDRIFIDSRIKGRLGRFVVKHKAVGSLCTENDHVVNRNGRREWNEIGWPVLLEGLCHWALEAFLTTAVNTGRLELRISTLQSDLIFVRMRFSLKYPCLEGQLPLRDKV